VRPGRALILSGPPGSGKSCAARLLAAERGYAVREWVAPMPTLWAERELAGFPAYESKMDAFEAWLQRARTLAPLPFAPSLLSKPASKPAAAVSPAASSLLLLEELPPCASQAAKQRLAAALALLAHPSRFPVILILDDEDAPGGGADSDSRLGVRELARLLEQRGAAHIQLNPATKAELSKLLARVSASEGLGLSAAQTAQCAEASRGDARAALSTFQLRFGGGGGGSGGSGGGGTKKRGSKKDKSGADAGGSWGARSDSLSLFHALGKLLYNKRLPVETVAPTPEPLIHLKASLVRPPAEVASAEAVLAMAGLSGGGALLFLFENAPDFLGEEGEEDAATLGEHFSDSDLLLCAPLGGGGGGGGGGGAETRGGETESESVRGRCGASVAARAVMCDNTHPAPSRFRQFRAPQGGAGTQRATRANAAEARRAGGAAAAGLAGGGSCAIQETLPFLRLLAPRLPEAAAALRGEAVGAGEEVERGGRDAEVDAIDDDA